MLSVVKKINDVVDVARGLGFVFFPKEEHFSLAFLVEDVHLGILTA